MESTKIYQFTKAHAVTIMGTNNPDIGQLVRIIHNGGISRLQFSMTPAQAREMSVALINHADAGASRMNRLMNLTLALAIACALAAVGTILDGPSDHEAEQAVANSLQDAKQAARDAKRERTIEEVMAGYSKLGEQK